VRLLHGLAKTHATFDDPDLVSRAGLADLVAEHVRIGRRCGVNAPVKVGCLVTGMISTPLAAPVIAATRLPGGSAASCRGAASFATASVATARKAGCSGTLVARADSAFYSAAFTGAVRAAGAFFSVTVRMDPKVKAAIAAIEEAPWTPIRYPRAVWDDQLGRCTDSPFETIQAEEQHRGHAQAEQVFADLAAGPLAHLPSGSFPASAAWLACAARTARHGREHITIHLPEGWHRETEWMNLFQATCGPPAAVA
jgi:hypothetical protein